MKCKICSTEASVAFKSKVLNKYFVSYFECPKCCFIQTEDPFWLEEAYTDALNRFDTGVMLRNKEFVEKISKFIFYFLDAEGTYLDYAGGYGIFTRMMRDIGYNYFWYDKYAQNLVAKGFDFELNRNNFISAVTSFEFFEHTISPHEELKKIINISDTIIFSTVLLPTRQYTKDWWYFGFEHGQHISLFSKSSLEYLASFYGLKFYTNDNNLHILTKVDFNKTDVEKYLHSSYISEERIISILKNYPEKQLNLKIKKHLGIKLNPNFFIDKYMKSKTMTDHFDLKRSFNMLE